MNRARKEQMLEEEIQQKLTTDLVMNIGMEMLNQNLPDSTKLFDLITLGEFRQLLEWAEEDPNMEIIFEEVQNLARSSKSQNDFEKL